MNSGIIEYFIKSGISLALFYILYLLFLSREKTFRFNRYYLLFSIILSHILPLIDLSGIFSSEVAISMPGTALQNLIFTQKELIPFSPEQVIEQAVKPEIDFATYLLYAYIAGVMILMIKTISGFIKLMLIYRRGLIRKFENYTIIYTTENIAPFSFLSYIFLNVEKINPDSIEQIMIHEKIHIKQFHTIDTLIAVTAAGVSWFNPFIWLIKKSLKETHEFLADEKVLAQGFDSASYSELLVNQIAGAKAMDFANCFNHLLIKRRLIMMKKLKPGRLAPLKIITIIPLALLLVLSFAIQAQEKNIIKSTNGEVLPLAQQLAKFVSTSNDLSLDIKTQEKTINKKVKKEAAKPYRTEAERAARKDSLMNLKNPTVSAKEIQGIIIGKQNIILPKEENENSGYSYTIGSGVNPATGKIELNVEKILKTNKKKSEKYVRVAIINLEEINKLMPTLTEEQLKDYKAKNPRSNNNKGYVTFIETLHPGEIPKNVEYWKTHK